MTGLEAAAPAAADSAPGSGAIRFFGRERPYWRLLIRGAFLLLLTLGIYRFWLTTDIRRFLWGNTEIAGNNLEYTGTGLELLVGFLFAVAILVPLYVLFFLAALDLGLLGELSGLLAFILLALLSQFAIYRARRYRLSRTVYRGVRFHQEGSAWRYAFYALFWWTVVLLTAGLAYPWAQAALERLKMRNTFFGNLAGRFEGSALSLFLRGVPMWLAVVGPFLAGIVAGFYTIDWPALAKAFEESGSGLGDRVESTNPEYAYAFIFITAAFIWAAVAAAVLYPVFQALVLRWWSSGLRFGSVTVTSHLRTGPVYRAYFRFLLYGILFTIVIAAIVWAAFALVDFLTGAAAEEENGELTVGILLVIGYMSIALGYSTIYQATVKFALWRLGMEAATLSGIDALDHVTAAGKPSSALGEGLVDALQVGGY
ncbi:MAG: DUF898 family protein [Xanthobacteraceae bacterium]